jgi:hypothetical protein
LIKIQLIAEEKNTNKIIKKEKKLNIFIKKDINMLCKKFKNIILVLLIGVF